MTSKERVMAALNHQPPDRIPKFDSFWAEFSNLCYHELALSRDTSLNDFFEVDVAIAIADETPFPTQVTTLSQDGDFSVRRDGWGRIIRTRKGAYFYEVLETCIQKKMDLDKVRFDSPSLDGRYVGFMNTAHTHRDRRAVFCKTGGPYLRTTFLRGEVEFLMDIAADPPFAKALADRVADHIIEIGKESLRRGDLYDTGLWIYDDMAHNLQPFVSPDSFEQIFLPAYKRMVRAFKEAGAAHVILHSDGNIGPFLDMLIEAGIDGINPVEPKAGLSIPELKKHYGEKLAFIGGMCNANVLPFGTHKEIEAQARGIIEVAQDGGVIIGAHSIGPDIPVRNYVCYHEIVMKEGVFHAQPHARSTVSCTM